MLQRFVMKRLSPDSEMWRQFRLVRPDHSVRICSRSRKQDSRTRVREVKEDIRRNVPKSRTTVFHDLLTSNLPESEKSTERLGMEAQALVGAGIETTAWSESINIIGLNCPVNDFRLLQACRSTCSTSCLCRTQWRNSEPSLRQLFHPQFQVRCRHGQPSRNCHTSLLAFTRGCDSHTGSHPGSPASLPTSR